MGAVLVLGAYGLLGCTLSERLTAAGFTVLRQGRNPRSEVFLNPLQAEAVTAVLTRYGVSAVVNLIATTSVDRCEQDCAAAFEANVRVVEVLGEALGAITLANRPIVLHISTDHLYQGSGPHSETLISPCNVYALTKYTGELAAAQFGATILRTNFFGRSACAGRISFTDWVVSSLRAGTEIPVFTDVLISALHMRTLSEAVARVLERPVAGVFNLGCRDAMSKAQMAFHLADMLGLEAALLKPVRMAHVNLAAPRPLDMTMDSTRFSSTFGFTLPTMESQLILAAGEYDHA